MKIRLKNMKKLLENSEYFKRFNYNSLSKNAYKFIYDNYDNRDLSDNDYIELIKNVQGVFDNASVALFERIKKGHLEKLFYYSFLINKKLTIPELLSLSNLPIDGSTIATNSKTLNKHWVNLSSILSLKDSYGPSRVNVNNTTELINYVNRGFLSESYTKKQGNWLPNNLALYLCEFYGSLCSNVLSTGYKLMYEEQIIVKYLFCYYYANLLTKLDKDNHPQLLTKLENSIFRKVDNGIIEGYKKIISENNGINSLDDIVNILKQEGSIKLKNISKNNVLILISTNNSELIASSIAMDYPPFLVHQMIQYASGVKNSKFENVIKQIQNKKSSFIKFVDGVVKDNNIFDFK